MFGRSVCIHAAEKKEAHRISSAGCDCVQRIAYEGKEMNITTAKEVLEKASGWATFSYVETKNEKEINGEKTTETRYELNCQPKKVKLACVKE